MTREEVLEKVTEVIRDVFDDDSIEDEFDIRFAMKDVAGMKNVGDMIDLIMEQAG